jgi:hypothetical protein
MGAVLPGGAGRLAAATDESAPTEQGSNDESREHAGERAASRPDT